MERGRGRSSVEELNVNSWTFNRRDCGIVHGLFGLVVWPRSGDGRRAKRAEIEPAGASESESESEPKQLRQFQPFIHCGGQSDKE